MNFDLSEEQQVVKDLATQILDDLGTSERAKAANEAGGFDAELWSALANAGLLGLCLPESVDGSGMGMVELCLVAEQQGRRVLPAPIGPGIVAARCLAEHLPAATDLVRAFAAGETVITAALAETGRNDPFAPTTQAHSVQDGVQIVGTKPAVPGLPIASHVLVPAQRGGDVVVGVVATDADGVEVQALSTTNHESQGHLSIDAVVANEWVIDDPAALDQLVWQTLLTNCAVQLGVSQGSVAYAAEHVSTRQQFNRPLSAFQAVSQRAADGYIVTEALRSTVLNASWQYDHGDDPQADILAAAYWASEGTQEIILGAQHLHGGLGADTDHPVHRHFLWGMQYAATLGTASTHLERLGTIIADAPQSA